MLCSILTSKEPPHVSVARGLYPLYRRRQNIVFRAVQPTQQRMFVRSMPISSFWVLSDVTLLEQFYAQHCAKGGSVMTGSSRMSQYIHCISCAFWPTDSMWCASMNCSILKRTRCLIQDQKSQLN